MTRAFRIFNFASRSRPRQVYGVETERKIGYWILDIGYWRLVVGYWRLGIGEQIAHAKVAKVGKGGRMCSRAVVDYLRPFQFGKGLGRPRRSSLPVDGIKVGRFNRRIRDDAPYPWTVGMLREIDDLSGEGGGNIHFE